MKKKHLQFFVAILLLAFNHACKVGPTTQKSNNTSVNTQASQRNQPPNIIFIMADDLGWGELGTYGNTFNETPNLDKLASQGLQFNQAYSAAPICSPTRASLMTGQYPARIGITDFLSHLSTWHLDPVKYVTINEAIASAGYHTGMTGKWHLDTNFKTNPGGPQNHGFHEVFGTETKYIADGDYFYPHEMSNTLIDGTEGEYLTDRQTTEGIKFIERNKEKPFFLYLSYYSVHTRLDAPQDLVNKFKKKYDAKHGAGEAEKIFEGNNKRHEADEVDNPYLAAMLERIDAGVGDIMAELEKHGLADNTLLIFYSDNGGAPFVANNGYLRSYKSWLYEGGIRVPLIMRYPGKIKAGVKTEVPATTMDFYPTLVEIAGGKLPSEQKLDGVSLVPFLFQGKTPSRETLFWHYASETGRWKEKMSSAIRKGDFKLIEFYENRRVELYNLKSDPSEKVNLTTKMPEKVKELKSMLDAWKNEVNAPAPAL